MRFDLIQQDNGLWNVYDQGMLVIANVSQQEAEDWCESVCAESFSAWLDRNSDSLPKPESFSDWLKQNNDSVLES